MSVIKSKRNESNMQYLKTAMDLQEYLLRQAKNWPKRYTFTLTKTIIDLATEAHVNVKMAKLYDDLFKEVKNVSDKKAN